MFGLVTRPMRSARLNATATAAELAATARHALAYLPAEFHRSTARRLAPIADGTPSRRYPVLFVHGLTGNFSQGNVLARELAGDGYDVFGFNYRTVGVSVEHGAREVASAVRHVACVTGADKVHVIGHSLGGLTIRAAAARHGVAAQLGAVITLGTPHQGAPLAGFCAGWVPLFGGVAAQLAHGSAFLRELDRASRDGYALSWTAIYSRSDELVPGDRGALHAVTARNVEMSKLGHMALVTAAAVLGEIRAALEPVDRPQLAIVAEAA